MLKAWLTTAIMLWPAATMACDRGDTKVGQNCVSTEMVDSGAHGRIPHTIVYRYLNGERYSVWEDYGTVEHLTDTTLVSWQLDWAPDGSREWKRVSHRWNGKAYVR